ncbi:putative 2,5-diketo-D-gluconic acid reductase [Gordonia polyisoprenivorans NBRC 16320 = JCM 10675]|nr:putative 2,5-diketo-D-gluconic acid reductase [Gordonia polyisoprenivorans NBRC 16320 = JCM 10675]
MSNFLPVHIKRLEEETGVLPVVNQIELHPYFPQTEAIAYHKNKGMLTEAWSPLGRGNDLLTNPIITEIAAKHSADPGQVVLSWTIARDAIPLPKAASPERQRVNLNAPSLALNPIEIEAITALGRPEGRTHDQDPAVYEEF